MLLRSLRRAYPQARSTTTPVCTPECGVMGRLEGLVTVGICSTFDTGDVTMSQETKVLVRSLGGLEDRGGLSVCRVIYTVGSPGFPVCLLHIENV